jgi:hypothetical protein
MKNRHSVLPVISTVARLISIEGLMSFLTSPVLKLVCSKRTPRTGLQFLGSGEESVAEHVFRVVFIGYALARLEQDVDELKVLKMCFLHDLPEARIGDLNYVNKKYVIADETKALRDLAETIPFGGDIEQIIEEFMIAANEAVAHFMEEKGFPFLYRIHEPPKKEAIDEFRRFISHLGYKVRKESDHSPKEFQRILSDVKGRPEERVVNEILLRSMKWAKYSARNLGHFGLASDGYTHFTSPIRRYPDLIVHRLLKKALSKASEAEAHLAGLNQLINFKIHEASLAVEELARTWSSRTRPLRRPRRENGWLSHGMSMPYPYCGPPRCAIQRGPCAGKCCGAENEFPERLWCGV